MKPAIFAATLFSSAFAVAPIPTAQQAKVASNYVLNAYIVEFSAGAVSRRTLISVSSILLIALRAQALEPFSLAS